MLLLCVIGYLSLHAQVNVQATIDSLDIMVGQQTKIHLRVEADANQKVVFPVFRDTLVTGVEIVEVSKLETNPIKGSNRIAVTQELLVTSFDSALYYIPPFDVTVDNRHFKSKSLALKVNTIPIPMDSVDVNQFFGPQDVHAIGYNWEDLKYVVYSIILLLVCCGVGGDLLYRYRNNKPIVRIVKLPPKLAPHQLAIQQIEAIKNSKLAESGDPKLYYTQLTDILRTYLNERFHFNATEMTSSEIIEQLRDLEGKDSLREFKTLLETADLVKFAKYVTQLNENDRNLMHALTFVNETKLEQIEEESKEETRVEVISGRTKQQQMVLLAVVVAMGVAAVASLGWLIWELKIVFFD